MNSKEEINAYKTLRTAIMQYLYRFFREHPYGLVELRTLEETCETDAGTLNWNLVYLDKCGYVELDNSQDCPPYISCTVSITAKGIELVESKAGCDVLF